MVLHAGTALTLERKWRRLTDKRDQWAYIPCQLLTLFALPVTSQERIVTMLCGNPSLSQWMNWLSDKRKQGAYIYLSNHWLSSPFLAMLEKHLVVCSDYTQQEAYLIFSKKSSNAKRLSENDLRKTETPSGKKFKYYELHIVLCIS